MKHNLFKPTARLQCYSGQWAQASGHVACDGIKVLTAIKQEGFGLRESRDFFVQLATAMNRVPDVPKPTDTYNKPRYQIRWADNLRPGFFSDGRTSGPVIVVHNDESDYAHESILCYVLVLEMGQFVCDFLNMIFGEWHMVHDITR